ncbi:MAG TPA: hypothetical protein VIF37_04695 [Methylobacter sp.]|jgi:hypothetical protein
MNNKQVRVDEVSQYYEAAAKAATIETYLFWLTAGVSLFMPYLSSVFDKSMQNIFSAVFITFVVVHFSVSQLSRFHLIPRAERKRRQQLLSDAFATPLSHDKTSLYYNNNYSPSVMRLGANIMENSLFSKEIASKMLIKSRIITGSYIVVWVLFFALRHDNINLLVWVTQLVFSSAIFVQWLNLEILRVRHESTYDQLHSHFLHKIGGDNQKAIATVLDSFASYEAAKAASGTLLSSKVFYELNPSLTRKWTQICKELNMDFQQENPPDKG